MSFSNPSKHSYLQKALCLFDWSQSIIDRLMDEKMSDISICPNLELPLPKLEIQIPNIYAPNVDPTRARKAFGNWALPKLKKELNYPDNEIVMQALNTILDMVYNPEKGFEAVRVGIVDGLLRIMLHEKEFIREKICMIFYILGSQEAGLRAIIRRYEALKNLFRLAEDESEIVRVKAAAVLEMLSRNVMGSIGLNCADCLVLTLRLIGGTPCTINDDILLINLSTLEMLLCDDCKLLALNHNALDILLQKIDHEREDISATALSCIALLCNHSEGRIMAQNMGLSNIICKKLWHESRLVRAKAATAFAFCTLNTNARLKVCNVRVMDHLIQLFEDFHLTELQLMAAKALTNLAENPDGRKYLLKDENKIRIENSYTNGNDEIERHKKILLEVINWKP